jgi:hypothetical protein
MRQPGDHQIGQPVQVVAGLARGDHQEDRLGQQPPRNERQRASGRAVQPLPVVDEAHHRTVAGRLRQQAQHREADEEALGSGRFGRWSSIGTQN